MRIENKSYIFVHEHVDAMYYKTLMEILTFLKQINVPFYNRI